MKVTWQRFLCHVGLHVWKYPDVFPGVKVRYRECVSCGKRRVLHFGFLADDN